MVDLPQPDPTTGLYDFTAKTNSGDVNRFSVSTTTPVRFVDLRSGTPRIVDFGNGPTAAAQAAAAAQATSDDSKGRANWQIQTGDGSGNWSTVGVDTTDKPNLLEQIGNVVLPLAAGLIPGIGPIAAGLLGATTSAGLNGLEGNSGSQTLLGAITGGLGAGVLNGVGGLSSLTGLGGTPATALPTNALGDTAIDAATGALPADLSTAIPDLTGATLPAAVSAAAPTALSGLTVTAAAPTAGLTGLPAAVAAAAPAIAGAVTPLSGVDVVAPRSTPSDNGTDPTPLSGVTVTATPSQALDPNLNPVVAAPVVTGLPSDLSTAVTGTTPTSGTTTPTPTQLADILKLITAGVVSTTGTPTSSGTPTSQALNPVFSGSLPTPSSWAVNTPTPAQNIDWNRYAFGPEAQFFSDTQRAPGGQGPLLKASGGGVQNFAVQRAQRPAMSFAVNGAGTGRSDSIPAKLSDGEYVMDAETVSMLGDGSSKAGAAKLDRFRANIRRHKGQNLVKGKFSADAKDPEAYLSGGRV